MGIHRYRYRLRSASLALTVAVGLFACGPDAAPTGNYPPPPPPLPPPPQPVVGGECQPFLPDQNPDAKHDRKVAVLGGGASGLLAAWNLRRLGYAVTVYEKKERLGGHVHTAKVDVPCETGDPCPAGTTKKRWDDLGVNDFNTKTYHYFTWILDLFAHFGTKAPTLRDGSRSYHSALGDTATFSTYDGKRYSTEPPDIYKPGAACDPAKGNCNRYSLAGKAPKPPAELAKEWATFEEWAPRVLEKNDPCRDATIDEYFFGKELEEAKEKKPIKQVKQVKQVEPRKRGEPCYKKAGAPFNAPEALANKVVKPRVNGMYFSNGKDPGSMRLYDVMYYYHLQEGLAHDNHAPTPDRRYFVGGASNWIEGLREALECKADNCDNLFYSPRFPAGEAKLGPPVDIVLGRAVTGIMQGPAGKLTVKMGSDIGNFDLVVVAVPAYVFNPENHRSREALEHDKKNYIELDRKLKDRDELIEALRKITYLESLSIIHKSPKFFTDNVDSASTYNILVPDYTPAPRGAAAPAIPYSISYLVNGHQADDMKAQYDDPQPKFYTSCGRKQEGHGIPVPTLEDALFTLDNGGLKKRAFEYMQHLVLDTHMDHLQKLINGERNHDKPGLQGMADGRLYWAGGWTHGPGLHELAFRQAVQVAYAIEWPKEYIDVESFADDPNAQTPPGMRGDSKAAVQCPPPPKNQPAGAH